MQRRDHSGFDKPVRITAARDYTETDVTLRGASLTLGEFDGIQEFEVPTRSTIYMLLRAEEPIPIHTGVAIGLAGGVVQAGTPAAHPDIVGVTNTAAEMGDHIYCIRQGSPDGLLFSTLHSGPLYVDNLGVLNISGNGAAIGVVEAGKPYIMIGGGGGSGDGDGGGQCCIEVRTEQYDVDADIMEAVFDVDSIQRQSGKTVIGLSFIIKNVDVSVPGFVNVYEFSTLLMNIPVLDDSPQKYNLDMPPQTFRVTASGKLQFQVIFQLQTPAGTTGCLPEILSKKFEVDSPTMTPVFDVGTLQTEAAKTITEGSITIKNLDEPNEAEVLITEFTYPILHLVTEDGDTQKYDTGMVSPSFAVSAKGKVEIHCIFELR